MKTLALPLQKTIEVSEKEKPVPYSGHAVASSLLVLSFLGYIVAYQTQDLHSLPVSHAFYGAMFIIVAPALALLLSVVSLRNGIKNEMRIRGMTLAYVSFFISALYFVTALAMPVVLLGLYLIYAYIW